MDFALALRLDQTMRQVDGLVLKVNQLLVNQHRMEATLATVTDALNQISTDLAGLEEDVQRVLDALANEDLSEEAQAAVDSLRSRMSNLNTTMDAAVPPTATAGSDPV